MANKLTFVEQEWTQAPPAGTKINWANPITKGMCALVTAQGNKLFEHTTSQFFPRNFIHRVLPSKLGINPSVTIYAEDTSAAAVLPNKTKADNIAGSVPFTIFSEFTGADGDFGLILGSIESGSGGGFRIYYDDYYAANTFGVRTTTGTTVNAGSSFLGANSHLFTHRVGVVCDTVNKVFWGNGICSAPSAYTYNITANANRRLWVARDSAGDPSGSAQSITIMFDRALSDAEMLSLSANPWQIFEPEQIPLFVPTVTAQYARPTSDVSAGTWTASTGSDLFAMLDETSANDSDYITTTSASTCEVALGSLSDPAISTGHIVRYRISATGGGIVVRLRQGTTTIASWTHDPAPSSLTTYAQTLTGGEADNITDYSALKLQFEAIA